MRKYLRFYLIFIFLIFTACGEDDSPAMFEELKLAISTKDEAAVQRILEENPEIVEKKDDMGNSPLHYAAHMGDTSLIQLILDKGGDIDSANKRGLRPIIFAVNNGDRKTVKYLVEKGSDINSPDVSGLSPVDWALYSRHPEIATFLVERGARFDISQPGITRLFNFSAFKDNTDVLTWLLGKGYSSSRRDKYGMTALHYAAFGGVEESIGLLLENGFSPVALDDSGNTPWSLAVLYGRKPDPRLKAGKGKSRLPVVTGDYPGSPPPGDKPEIFARDIISSFGYEHSAPVFSKDGSHIYWSTFFLDYRNQQIFEMKKTDGEWSSPERLPLPPEHAHGTPVISPDGERLFFTSDMPSGKKTRSRDNVWFMNKTPAGWGKPVPLGIKGFRGSVNAYFSLADSGKIYFSVKPFSADASIDIYSAEPDGDGFKNATLLPREINSDLLEMDPFISPDESYLIFSRGGNGASIDLFISFRGKDGAWSEAHNMGEAINSSGFERFPYVSPDGKYLFFTSDRDGSPEIYWVNAAVIEKLR